MAGYYIYLISSLPVLHFGARPPFSFERFLRLCGGVMEKDDIDALRTISLTGETAKSAYEDSRPALTKWRVFDTMLRNELVKIRAARKKIDPLKYIREDGHVETDIAHTALHAHRAPSILESEKILDEARWRFLDECAIAHYFDIDAVIIYACKLLILERWERINTADRSRALDDVTAIALEPTR